MPDHSLHEEGDAAARLEAARAEMVAAATEAWEAIRTMEPSAERFDLERSFADQARTQLSLAPANPPLARPARAPPPDEDPYVHPPRAPRARTCPSRTLGTTSPR